MKDFRVTFYLGKDICIYIDTAPNEYEAIRQTLSYIPASAQPLFHGLKIEHKSTRPDKDYAD